MRILHYLLLVGDFSKLIVHNPHAQKNLQRSEIGPVLTRASISYMTITTVQNGLKFLCPRGIGFMCDFFDDFVLKLPIFQCTKI